MRSTGQPSTALSRASMFPNMPEIAIAQSRFRNSSMRDPPAGTTGSAEAEVIGRLKRSRNSIDGVSTTHASFDRYSSIAHSPRGDVSRCAAERPSRLRQLLASAGERGPINRARYREEHVPSLALRQSVRDQRVKMVEARQIDPRQAPLPGKGVFGPPLRRNAPGRSHRLRQIRQIIGRLIENA